MQKTIFYGLVVILFLLAALAGTRVMIDRSNPTVPRVIVQEWPVYIPGDSSPYATVFSYHVYDRYGSNYIMYCEDYKRMAFEKYGPNPDRDRGTCGFVLMGCELRGWTAMSKDSAEVLRKKYIKSL